MTSLRFLSTGFPKRAGKIHILLCFSSICLGLGTSEYYFLIHYESVRIIVVLSPIFYFMYLEL